MNLCVLSFIGVFTRRRVIFPNPKCRALTKRIAFPSFSYTLPVIGYQYLYPAKVNLCPPNSVEINELLLTGLS